LDPGAVAAVRRKKSLFAVGVGRVRGEFPAQAGVAICDARTGAPFARGLCNYSSAEARRILGLATRDQPSALGYPGPEELVHRDNLLLLEFEGESPAKAASA
jgi:glutamate 5-kinase